jgi:hypothetical protein
MVPQTIDLYGRAQDGSLLLWKPDAQVVAATALERNGCWIRSGHYVINHNGAAIVVHCGNRGDGSVSVQFMDADLTQQVLPRYMIESILLGKIVVSEEQRAAVSETRRLSDFFADCGPPDGRDDDHAGAAS